MINKIRDTEAFDLQSTRICDFCVQNICESEKLWDKHHEAFDQLEQSAAQNCVFCSGLLRTVEEHFSNPSRLKLPLYRWNIRRLTRVRETRDIVAIVFRPVGVDQDADVGEVGGALPEKTFHLYREQDLGKLPDETGLGPSTDSAQSWSQVRQWITECTTNHRRCGRKAETALRLPTRLLDIGEIDPVNPKVGRVRLVDTTKQHINEDYVTVSHKWGSHKFITSTADNQAAMMTEGFPMDDDRLTNNFREAIVVARRLGKRYIWIDSICILQDKASGDFVKEAPRMHQYYRYAFCNIAAADADEPYEGLFRDRSPDDTQHPISFARYTSDEKNQNLGAETWVVIPVDLWEDQLLQNPLYSRGWVFQERMLAPRILHFSRNQIFFECATISACEILPAGIPRATGVRAAVDRHWRERLHHDLSGSKRPLVGTADLSIEDFWGTAVKTYTRCNLTNSSDKIVAISGVATLVENALGHTYRDGLWDKYLEEQLAWRIIECRQENGKDSIKRKGEKFPSWSWASVDGVVDLQERFEAHKRVYRVCGHDDKPIRFELDKSEQTIDVPNVLVDVDVTPGEVKATATDAASPTETSHSSARPDQSSTIKIRGYVRPGHISWDGEARKGLLTPVSSKLAKCEALLDQIPDLAEHDAHFVVLAYSSSDEAAQCMPRKRSMPDDPAPLPPPGMSIIIDEPSEQSNKPTTYSGIGLILREDFPNYFYRLGAFTFAHLDGELLATLTTTSASHKADSELGYKEPPRDFYLY